MFDEFGNWTANAGPTFPAMQGYGGNSAPTSYLDLMQSAPINPSSYMGSSVPTTGPLASMGTSTVAAPNSMWDNFLGSPGQQGWGGMALGAASGLMNGFIGLQQLGVAKKTLSQNQRQFDLNFGAQQKMTNSRLADRQATRVASGLTNVGVDDYMKRYGI